MLHWKEVVLQLQLVETGMNEISITGFSLEAGITTNILASRTGRKLPTFQLPTIDWTLETRPRREKMSDLPFSIKNILSGNIAKKEHLQRHFCPLFSRCPWSYVPRIQFSSSISKKMKRGKRSVFSKDQVAKLEKSFQKRVREAFVKVGSVFCPCNPNTPLFARKSSRQTVLFARRNNPDHWQRRPSWKLFSLFGGIFHNCICPCWPLLPRNATSDLITAFHCRNIFPKRTRISLQPSCVYPGNRFLILDQTIFNSMRPSPVPLVTCTTSCRLRHGFKTEEPRRRDWRMKRIRVYRFDSKEVSCRKTEGKSMIDEESLVLLIVIKAAGPHIS